MSFFEVDSRELCDGSRTSITLFARADSPECLIEAENWQGKSSYLTPNRAIALEVYWHPFSREGWLDYPGVNDRDTDVVRQAQYALAHADEMVESE